MKNNAFFVSIMIILHALQTALGASPHSRIIVDYGADMCGFNLNYYRNLSPGALAIRQIEPVKDMDNNGSLENDFVSGWKFSETEPLNFPYAPLYDLAQPNARIYGGLMVYAINTPNRTISEGMLNANHGSRDDFNFMALGNNRAFAQDEQFAAYACWFFDQQDFLNDGNKHTVTFDENSRISVYVSRYWGGLQYGRWMVRDGDEYYVSEDVFAGVNQLIDASTSFSQWGGHPLTQKSHTVYPLKTRWAKYEPKGIEDETAPLEFSPEEAEFKEHTFQDVTAVGLLVGRELLPTTRAVNGGLSRHQPLALKWYALQCSAVVNVPKTHSTILPSAKAGDLWVALTETSFEQWETVRRHGVTSQYPREIAVAAGYSLQRDGSMGSMALAEGSYTPSHPVTDISFSDAIAFCNILSELEGREPVYYADAELSTVLRQTVNRNNREAWGSFETIYLKNNADGWRLPTLRELASVSSQASSNEIRKKTSPVLEASVSETGHHGVKENVWEFVWPSRKTSIDPNTAEITVAGGAFDGQSKLPNKTGFDLNLSRGHYAVGFRAVRGRVSNGLPKPTPDFLSIQIKPDSVLKADTPAKGQLATAIEKLLPLTEIDAGILTKEDFNPFDVVVKKRRIAQARNEKFLGSIDQTQLDQIIEENTVSFKDREAYAVHFGAVEIPYKLWIRVKLWAEQNGYTFNFAGDMGSMRYLKANKPIYTPDQPVTHISLFDALVWCNALSELTGRKPVYVIDEAATQPYRTALQFRLDMYTGILDPIFPPKVNKARGRNAQRNYSSGSMDLIFMDATANGFRLPHPEEWKRAYSRPSSESRLLAHEWMNDNSEGLAQKVGSSEPNEYGIYDLEGNVYEWSWDPEHGYTSSLGHYILNGSGCFTVPADQIPALRNKSYGDASYTARPYYGFRVLRPVVEK